MHEILRVIALAIGLHRNYGTPFDVAITHAGAAVMAEAPELGLRAELLLPIAHRESRFERLAGPGFDWPEYAVTRPPYRWFICGPMSTTMATWPECVRVRDPLAGYREGVAQLRPWFAYCRSIGRAGRDATVCALAGYARGGDAAREGDDRWSRDLLIHARLLGPSS